MRIWGISDLHLSFATPKPMDVFGSHWRGHAAKMRQAWDAQVAPRDVVLCPGDLSWAMHLRQAKADLQWIGQRPGHKILLRGNHDYWWGSVTQVRAALARGCTALQNNAVDVGAWVIAGARGWVAPKPFCHPDERSEEGSPHPSERGEIPRVARADGRDARDDKRGIFDQTPSRAPAGIRSQDHKIYQRELVRLRLSLQDARKIAPHKPILAALHYPPFTAEGRPTDVVDLLRDFGVRVCVYGHLHGARAHAAAVEGEVNGIAYSLIACDYLGFRPKLIVDSDSQDLSDRNYESDIPHMRSHRSFDFA
ncbi:MAG: metallophosphoesterase [Myxococcota bacterium]